MRLSTRPFPNLCDADMIPYYWRPCVWFRWAYEGYTTWDDMGDPHWHSRLAGVQGRIGPLGFVTRFRHRGGRFRNGNHWYIFFRYRREIEEMIS